jgi:hypothetical protein
LYFAAWKGQITVLLKAYPSEKPTVNRERDFLNRVTIS